MTNQAAKVQHSNCAGTSIPADCNPRWKVKQHPSRFSSHHQHWTGGPITGCRAASLAITNKRDNLTWSRKLNQLLYDSPSRRQRYAWPIQRRDSTLVIWSIRHTWYITCLVESSARGLCIARKIHAPSKGLSVLMFLGNYHLLAVSKVRSVGASHHRHKIHPQWFCRLLSPV